MIAQKTSAEGLATDGAHEEKQHREFTARSTAVEAQRARIVDALRTGPKTSYELRRAGCYQAPARIHELRHRFGFDIRTSSVALVDDDGFMHPRCALYVLAAEPGA